MSFALSIAVQGVGCLVTVNVRSTFRQVFRERSMPGNPTTNRLALVQRTKKQGLTTLGLASADTLLPARSQK